MKKNHSLRKVIVTTSVRNALLALVILAVLLSVIFFNFFVNYRINTNMEIANGIKEQLRIFLNYSSRLANQIDSVMEYDLGSAQVDSPKNRASLNAILRNNMEIKSILVLDTKGRLLLNEPYDAMFIGSDHSRRDYYYKLKRVGDVVWSDVFITYDSNIPLTTISKRFKDNIVVLNLNLKYINDFIKIFSTTENSIITVVDKYGNYIAHRDYTKVESRETDPNFFEIVNYPKQKDYTYESQKMRVYTSKVGETDWMVIIYQSYADLFAPVIQSVAIAALVSLFCGMILLMSSWRNYTKIRNNIDTIVRETKAVALGHYPIHSDITSDYAELNAVMAALYSMTKKIQEREALIEERSHEINEMNINLEELVRERTVALSKVNFELLESIEDLRETQDKLIQSEKMASLGNLVAGISHELNTPIGISVTTTSYVEKLLHDFEQMMGEKSIKKSDILKFIEDLHHANSIVSRNMERAADLIVNFKQVAIEQQSNEIRLIEMNQIINATLVSLSVELRRSNIELEKHFEGNMNAFTYPGAISQIITNLVQNSIVHAFDGKGSRKILVSCTCGVNDIVIKVHDNGNGIPEEIRNKIYDPFFTTARGRGGSGLGLNIVYNLATVLLKGELICNSSPEDGTTFIISLPRLQLEHD